MSHDDSRGLRSGTGGVNRRKALKALAAAGGVGLAGCSGGGGGDGGDGGDGGGGGGGGDGGDGGGGGDGGDGGSNGSGNQKSDIDGDTVHFVKGDTGDSMAQLLKRIGNAFKEETGATMDWEFTGIGDSKFERLVALIQSGDPPEIGTVNLTVGIQFRKRGALAPMGEAMQFLIDKHGEPDVRYQADGNDWMIPFTQGVTDYWYRRDKLDQIGLSSDYKVETWDKLMQYAEATDENSDIMGTQRGVFVASGKAKATGNFMWGSYLMTNEGQVSQKANTDSGFEVAYLDGKHRTRAIETLEYIGNLHDHSVDAGGAGESENEHALPSGLGNATTDAGCRVKLHSAHHQGVPYTDGDASWVQNLGHCPANDTDDSQAQVGPLYVFSGADDVQAGREFIKFMYGNVQYASDFCWADGPVHCQPPFPGIKKSDYYSGLLREELADHWWLPEEEPHNNVPEMARRHQIEATSNAMPQVFETDPPNPWVGAIWASAIQSEMVREVNIRDKDPEAVVDEYGPRAQEIMERAAGTS